MKEIESEKYIKKKLRDYTEFPLVDDKQRKTLIHVPLGKLQEAFEDGYECATKWIDVNDRLPNEDENVLVSIQDIDKQLHTEIRWRAIYDYVICDVNGFVIYPPTEKRVLAWMPIPKYGRLKF